jgi:hypothetical protein
VQWYQFLKEERARKLAAIDDLASGKIAVAVNYQDVSQQMIADHQEHIAEIEAILAGAGHSFDA